MWEAPQDCPSPPSVPGFSTTGGFIWLLSRPSEEKIHRGEAGKCVCVCVYVCPSFKSDAAEENPRLPRCCAMYVPVCPGAFLDRRGWDVNWRHLPQKNHHHHPSIHPYLPMGGSPVTITIHLPYPTLSLFPFQSPFTYDLPNNTPRKKLVTPLCNLLLSTWSTSPLARQWHRTYDPAPCQFWTCTSRIRNSLSDLTDTRGWMPARGTQGNGMTPSAEAIWEGMGWLTAARV